MAGKKNDPFQNNTSVDDDWDLDDFDDFDSDFDDIEPDPKPKSKSRQAIEFIGTTATTALKGATLESVNKLRRDVEKNMPHPTSTNAMNDLADTASGFFSEFNEVKQELIRNSAQLTTQTKQLVRNILPKINKVLPDKLNKRLEEFSKEVEEKVAEQQKSLEEQRREEINSAITNSLNLQIKQGIEDSNERRYNTLIDRRLTEKQHKSTIEALAAIYKEAQYNTEFFKTTTTGYYTKSLELQYQSLFAERDILSTLQVMSKSFDTKLEAIVQNSALPDIQKQRKLESIKASMRGKFADTVSSKASEFIKNAGKRLIKHLGSKTSGMAGQLSNMLMMTNMGLQQAQQAADMGINTGPGLVTELASDALGSMAGAPLIQKFINKTFGKLDKKKRDRILNTVSTLANGEMSNLSTKLMLNAKDLLTKGENYQDNDPGILKSLKSMVIRQASGLIRAGTGIDEFGKTGANVTNLASKKPTEATPFDIATRTSIVDIIPGYLAKILQQVSAFNSGKLTEELMYDRISGEFYSSSKMNDILKKRSTNVRSDLDRSDRKAGVDIAAGVSQITAGLNQYTNNEEIEEFKLQFKESEKYVEKVMQNIAVAEIKFSPEYIKKYAEDAHYEESDYGTHIDAYIGTIFKDVPQKLKKSLAILFSKAFFTPEGKLNRVLTNNFYNACIDLMNKSVNVDVIQDAINSGNRRALQGIVKNSEYGGELSILNDELIDEEFYKGRNLEKYKEHLQRHHTKTLDTTSNMGFSADDVLSMIPIKQLRARSRALAKKKGFGKKQFFADSMRNNSGTWNVSDLIDESQFDNSNTDVSEQIIETFNRPVAKASLTGSDDSSSFSNVKGIYVTGTYGKHPSLKPLGRIIELLTAKENDKTQETNVVAQTESPDNEFKINVIDNLSSIKESSINLLASLETLRGELKALSTAQIDTMISLKTSGQPNSSMLGKVFKGLGKSAGFIGKGIFGTMNASAKGAWGATAASIKAVGNIVPSILPAVGKTLGASIGGLGYAAGAMFKANGAAVKGMGSLLGGMFKGAGSAVGGILGLGGLTKSISNKINGADTVDANEMQDVYTFGKKDAAITKKDFMKGVYTKALDGKMKLISSVKEITGAVYDSEGNELLSETQFLNGIFNKKGKKFITKATSAAKTGGSAIAGIGKGLLGAVGTVGGGIAKGIGGLLGLSGSATGAMMNMGLGALKFGGKAVGTLASKLLGFDKKSQIEKKDLKEQVGDKLDEVNKKLDKLYDAMAPKSVFGDHDGDGDREGSYTDYEQKKKERLAALEAKRLASKKDPFPGTFMNQVKPDSDDEGFLSTLFSLFGGKKLLASFTAAKGKMFGLITKLISGSGKFAGKGILGLLGLILGPNIMSKLTGMLTDSAIEAVAGAAAKGAVGKVAGAAAKGAAGKVAGGAATKLAGKGFAVAAGGAAAVAAAAPAAAKLAAPAATAATAATEVATKASAKNAATAVAAAGTSKEADTLTKIIKLAKEKCPKSMLGFLDKLEKIVVKIAAKLGPKAMGKIAAKFLSGPIGWIWFGGEAGYYFGKGMLYPHEVIGVPEEVDIDLADRTIIAGSLAVSEALFLGLISPIDIIGFMDVNLDKYMKTAANDTQAKTKELEEDVAAAEQQEKQKEEQKNKELIASLSAGTAALYDKTKEVGSSIADKTAEYASKTADVVTSNVKTAGSAIAAAGSTAIDYATGDSTPSEAGKTITKLNLKGLGDIKPMDENVLAQQYANTKFTRGRRNNNPGNVIVSSWTRKRPGFVDGDRMQKDGKGGPSPYGQGKFGMARFSAPEFGIATALTLTKNTYGAQGLDTIRKITHKYSPPYENNTALLIKQYSKASGFKPDEKINWDNQEAIKRYMAEKFRMESSIVFPDDVMNRAFALVYGGGDAENATGDKPDGAMPTNGATSTPTNNANVGGEAIDKMKSNSSNAGESTKTAVSDAANASANSSVGQAVANTYNAAKETEGAATNKTNEVAGAALDRTKEVAGSTFGGSPGTGPGADAINKYIAIARRNAQGARYSQANRMGKKSYDCSSFVSRTLKEAGFDVNPRNTTLDIRKDFERNGFKWHSGHFGPATSTLQPGDILLKDKGDHRHTEIYTGGGKSVGAHSTSSGVSERRHWTGYNYNGFLRLEGRPNIDGQSSESSKEEFGSEGVGNGTNKVAGSGDGTSNTGALASSSAASSSASGGGGSTVASNTASPAASGGTSSDSTQSTSTGTSTGSNSMSTVPAGGGAGSATAENVASSSLSSDSTPVASTSTDTTVAAATGPITATLDDKNIIEALNKQLEFLREIAGNSSKLNDLDKLVADGNTSMTETASSGSFSGSNFNMTPFSGNNAFSYSPSGSSRMAMDTSIKMPKTTSQFS